MVKPSGHSKPRRNGSTASECSTTRTPRSAKAAAPTAMIVPSLWRSPSRATALDHSPWALAATEPVM